MQHISSEWLLRLLLVLPAEGITANCVRRRLRQSTDTGCCVQRCLHVHVWCHSWGWLQEQW